MKGPSRHDDQSLQEWLEGLGVPTELYGLHGSKPLVRLLDEMRAGESRIAVDGSGRPVREVRVATVRVTCGPRVLVETRQETADGRSWTRDLQGDSLAEKIRGDESPESAAARGVREELGLGPLDFRLLPGGHEVLEERESRAYPGLLSRYRLFRRRVEILPSGFRPEGYEEHQPDKTTYFEWTEGDRDAS